MSTLFISDLHLDPAYPEIISSFLRLLDQDTLEAEALYILGDLFETWIGDDYIEPAFQPVIEALRNCSDRIPVYLMRGNRDFMISDQFGVMTGCRLLPDATLIDLYDQTALLMHGDTLCTDDTDYQQFRSMVRDPEWQKSALEKSVEQRLSMAREARSLSNELSRDKPDMIMDVNILAVRDHMLEHHSHLLIHGHTHRPFIHKFHLNGQPARRAVLGAWHEQGSLLRADPGVLELEFFPLLTA